MTITTKIDEGAGTFQVSFEIDGQPRVVRGHLSPALERSEFLARALRDTQWIVTAGILHELREMKEADRAKFIEEENKRFKP